MRKWSSRRGFAVLTAIAVLAILGMLAIAAANSVQFTFSYASRRTVQSRLGQALSEGALFLTRKPEMLKTLESGTTVTLFAGSKSDLPEVTAVPGRTEELALLGELVPPQDGDRIVQVNAAFAGPRASTLSAVYLINASGLRASPILLREMLP